MPPIRPGQRGGPARQRRRVRRATAGQVHVYPVPNHLDEPNIVRWGLTAEQMLFVLAGASVLAVLTVVLLLGGLVLVRATTGQRAALWNLAPLLLLLLIRPLVAFAKWRPDGLGPVEYVLLRATTWRQPQHATWLPEVERDAFAPPAPVHEAADDGADGAPLAARLADPPAPHARPAVGPRRL